MLIRPHFSPSSNGNQLPPNGGQLTSNRNQLLKMPPIFNAHRLVEAAAEESSAVGMVGWWQGAWRWAERAVYSAAIEPAKARSQDSSNRRVIFLAEVAA